MPSTKNFGGTATTNASTAVPIQQTRFYLDIQNYPTSDFPNNQTLWVSMDGDAATAGTKGEICLPPGAHYEILGGPPEDTAIIPDDTLPPYCPTEAISVCTSTGSAAYGIQVRTLA